ncbi:MAG: hypothetical protein JJ902_22375 [Roseibium sp.]|nr:hypothetical protein [Roseibium sp.]
MTSGSEDRDTAFDQALKQVLDYDVDEARIERRIRERIANPGGHAGFGGRLQGFVLLHPARAITVCLAGAFVLGLAIPFEPAEFGGDDAIRFALGDMSLVLGLQETR